MVCEHKPDLIILDVIMPGKSGREIFEEIRKMKPDPRVIFITGYTIDIIDEHNLPPAVFPLIHKPFIPQELLRLLRITIDKPCGLTAHSEIL